VVRAEEKDFRNEHYDEAGPRKPAFGIHGGGICGRFAGRRQT
jgi:hypothetical protein